MIRQDPFRSATKVAALLCLAVFSLPILAARAAIPFNKATVTKVENRVDYGEVRGGRTQKRRAAVSDVVRANNFLLTETESRAELQYEDGSVVRIGQNTVFSFDADTRTLTLEKGTLIFYIPKGSGGAQVKTASLTAAITGTVGKVSSDTIAILEGEVMLIPSGRRVGAGEFARLVGGVIEVKPFNPVAAPDGALMAFNGPMPGFDESRLVPGQRLALSMPNLGYLDALERTQNHPAALLQRTRVFVPPPPPPKQNGGPY